MTENNSSLLQTRLVNGVHGDPAVFCQLPQSSRALLFDAGDLNAVSNKDLLRIKYVCISHTHIDHFIGFDRLLRVHIPHQRPLHFYGPEGLTGHVMGKLQGYTWNLILPFQLNFHIVECRADGSLRETHITNNPEFQSRTVSDWSPARALALEPGIELRIQSLTHGNIASCAFELAIDRKNTVSMEHVMKLGLSPGNWIAKLQDAVKDGRLGEPIDVLGRSFKVSELAKDVLLPQNPFRFLYVTDVGFASENITALTGVGPTIDVALMESSFRDADAARAFSKRHLTTRQAALLATVAGVRELQTFHYSQIYGEDKLDEHAVEAQAFFTEFKAMTPSALAEALMAECKRNENP